MNYNEDKIDDLKADLSEKILSDTEALRMHVLSCNDAQTLKSIQSVRRNLDNLETIIKTTDYEEMFNNMD